MNYIIPCCYLRILPLMFFFVIFYFSRVLAPTYAYLVVLFRFCLYRSGGCFQATTEAVFCVYWCCLCFSASSYNYHRHFHHSYFYSFFCVLQVAYMFGNASFFFLSVFSVQLCLVLLFLCLVCHYCCIFIVIFLCALVFFCFPIIIIFIVELEEARRREGDRRLFPGQHRCCFSVFSMIFCFLFNIFLSSYAVAILSFFFSLLCVFPTVPTGYLFSVW